jgi:hypothetical protein
MAHPYGDTRIDCPNCTAGTLRVSRHGVECPVCEYTTVSE